MNNIIDFRSASASRAPTATVERRHRGSLRKPYERRGPNMQTFVFRSYDLIVESAEADLLRDVSCDIHKAENKLRKLREQLQRDRENAAAREALLTSAENKLSAAIAAARSLTPAPEPLTAKERRTNSEAMARKREFKEAMRARLAEIAEARGLSASEVKAAWTLKHEAVGRFCQQHGVNIEWLLEGKGRTFKSDPIALNRNMTGAELAALVRALPEFQQRKIEAVIDLLSEKGRP